MVGSTLQVIWQRSDSGNIVFGSGRCQWISGQEWWNAESLAQSIASSRFQQACHGELGPFPA